jgi:tetraacyldisaccharide 4'-kinase
MIFRYLLFPFAFLFSIIVFIRNLFYKKHLFKSISISKPVICVGNLTTGGTGKTPWVQLISQILIDNEKTHAIISRGYTGDFSGVLQVDSNMDPRKCGDEPLWLKRNTFADVFVGSKRVDVANKALQHKSYDCFILDDGFQHRQLARDLDIVIIDASASLNDYYYLPMGRMRENFSSLKRAQIVIINKCNYAQQNQIDFITGKIKNWADPQTILNADFVFDDWIPIIEHLPTTYSMNKNNVCLSCGVGNPDAFVKTVEEQKMIPVKSFIYPDHYYWKPNDIEKMTYQMKLIKSHDLVITEKDAVKLIRYKKHFKEMGIQVWVCKMKIKIRHNEEFFYKKLLDQFKA